MSQRIFLTATKTTYHVALIDDQFDRHIRAPKHHGPSAASVFEVKMALEDPDYVHPSYQDTTRKMHSREVGTLNSTVYSTIVVTVEHGDGYGEVVTAYNSKSRKTVPDNAEYVRT